MDYDLMFRQRDRKSDLSVLQSGGRLSPRGDRCVTDPACTELALFMFHPTARRQFHPAHEKNLYNNFEPEILGNSVQLASICGAVVMY